MLGGSGRFGRKVGAGDGGATRGKGREVLVAPYAGVHLTRKRRRWCAAVRRGRHTKSAGYSGHVAQAGTGPGFPRERLAYHLRSPSRLPSPLPPLSVRLPHFARSQTLPPGRTDGGVLIGLRGDTH